MLIDIDESDFCLLLESFINKSMTDKILSYVHMIDIDKYPYLLLKLGNYFKLIKDYDNMFTYLERCLRFSDVKTSALVSMADYFVVTNQISKFDKLAKDYNFTKELYIRIANMFRFTHSDFSSDIYNRFPCMETYMYLKQIYISKKNYGQYIKCLLLLSKKYADRDSKNAVKNMIQKIILGRRNGETMLFFFDKRKCHSCGVNDVDYIQLECKHYLCKNCCYQNMNPNTCMTICSCDYKSSLLFNLLTENLC